jgi:hypothetical protein
LEAAVADGLSTALGTAAAGYKLISAVDKLGAAAKGFAAKWCFKFHLPNVGQEFLQEAQDQRAIAEDESQVADILDKGSLLTNLAALGYGKQLSSKPPPGT